MALGSSGMSILSDSYRLVSLTGKLGSLNPSHSGD